MKKMLFILCLVLMSVGSVLSVYGTVSIKSGSNILGISALFIGSVSVALAVFCAAFSMDVDK